MHRRFIQKRFQSSSTKNLIPIRTSLKGAALLQQPVLNKGSAFTREEREVFQVDGHIPYDVHSLEKQMVRAYAQFKKQPSNILKVRLTTPNWEDDLTKYTIACFLSVP